ncbi:UNKNOWN [Stylonychia lemnae]|uniref:DBF4-type domain-containing protein n=1 Tax=Stylonychia lemnae TaxID=5949 RepID=A0A077ZWA4_STYLE|nr:UNKNOWN [Stylonychia lemnae]|eukprot:CDW73866.1 UNKNOWN [Stylonychia lemnae]
MQPTIHEQLSKILLKISSDNAQSLWKLSNFNGISFTANPDEFNDVRKHREISQAVGKLKGQWRLSYGEKVNYYIMPESFFLSSQSIKEIVQSDILDRHRIHNWIKQTIANQLSQFIQQQQIELKPRKSNDNESVLKLIEKFSSMRVNEDHRNYGKIINIKDFNDAAKYLLSSYPDFHNERIHTLLVYDEQDKPNKFDAEQYIVVTKIDVPKDKNQVALMDFQDRQVFHKFEKLTQQTNHQKPKFDYHKFRIETSDSIAAVCTMEELNYFNKNSEWINEQKLKSLKKDEDKVCLSEIEGQQFVHYEQMPNLAHAHCGICRVNYTSYFEHIESKEHLNNTKAQQTVMKMIDVIFEERAKQNRWRTSPLIKQISKPLVQIEDHKMEIEQLQPPLLNLSSNQQVEHSIKFEDQQEKEELEDNMEAVFQDIDKVIAELSERSKISAQFYQEQEQRAKYNQESYIEDVNLLYQEIQQDLVQDVTAPDQKDFIIKNYDADLVNSQILQEIEEIEGKGQEDLESFVPILPKYNAKENLSTINECSEGKSQSNINIQSTSFAISKIEPESQLTLREKQEEQMNDIHQIDKETHQLKSEAEGFNQLEEDIVKNNNIPIIDNDNQENKVENHNEPQTNGQIIENSYNYTNPVLEMNDQYLQSFNQYMCVEQTITNNTFTHRQNTEFESNNKIDIFNQADSENPENLLQPQQQNQKPQSQQLSQKSQLILTGKRVEMNNIQTDKKDNTTINNTQNQLKETQITESSNHVKQEPPTIQVNTQNTSQSQQVLVKKRNDQKDNYSQQQQSQQTQPTYRRFSDANKVKQEELFPTNYQNRYQLPVQIPPKTIIQHQSQQVNYQANMSQAKIQNLFPQNLRNNHLGRSRFNLNQPKYFIKTPTSTVKQEKRKADDHLDDSKNPIQKRQKTKDSSNTRPSSNNSRQQLGLINSSGTNATISTKTGTSYI